MTTLEQMAIERHGPVMGSVQEQIAHAMRLEVQRLTQELSAQKAVNAIFAAKAIAYLREQCK